VIQSHPELSNVVKLARNQFNDLRAPGACECSARKKKVNLYSERMELVISSTTEEYMPTLIRCSGYESGGLQGHIMMSRDSSDSYSTWNITCQMSAHTEPLWLVV
jgi:hypothetical protein